MNILFLIVFLVAALGGVWYYSQNKEKVKEWFSKKTKEDTSSNNINVGDVYVANIENDCTGKSFPESKVNKGAFIEIQVHSSDKASIHGLVKGKSSAKDMFSGKDEKSSPSDIQTGIFVETGCIKFDTTNGDVITYDLKDSDLLKWSGLEPNEKMNSSVVFKRENADTITATNPIDGSVCRFKKQTDKKAPKECSYKPGFGCNMM